MCLTEKTRFEELTAEQQAEWKSAEYFYDFLEVLEEEYKRDQIKAQVEAIEEYERLKSRFGAGFEPLYQWA